MDGKKLWSDLKLQFNRPGRWLLLAVPLVSIAGLVVWATEDVSPEMRAGMIFGLAMGLLVLFAGLIFLAAGAMLMYQHQNNLEPSIPVVNPPPVSNEQFYDMLGRQMQEERFRDDSDVPHEEPLAPPTAAQG
tara:strand:+ start:187 stop:582 length:396 start_codon:yes stop_codon:yes gene_type:complete